VRYLWASRPLDPDAVRAANDAVRGETGGRSLTMNDSDPALREKWMAAYQHAGGKVTVVDTEALSDPCSPVKPCGCKPIASLEILSVEFTSDHRLLKNEATKWTDTGSPYPVPQWVKGGDSQSPIRHTMDKQIAAKVKSRCRQWMLVRSPVRYSG
jgi:hypothetical protein